MVDEVDVDGVDGVVVEEEHALPPGLVVVLPPHENVRPSPMLHVHSPVVPQHAWPSIQIGFPLLPGSSLGSQHIMSLGGDVECDGDDVEVVVEGHALPPGLVVRLPLQ